MSLPISFYGLDRFYKQNKEKILQLTDLAYQNGQFLDSDIVKQFEKNLANYCNRKYALTVSSCTDALFLSLKTLNIQKDDEIIIPAFSFIASLSPILHLHAIPVFIDINPQDLSVNTTEIKQKITSKTKAILIVQLFGGLHNFSELEELSNKYGIPIIEDSAQSLGASFQNRKAGSLGTISCISFDPSKIIHAFGTGGAILTDNELIYQKLKRLHYHGKEQGNFVEAGYNSRISSSQASLLNWQLENIEKIIEKRNSIAQEYRNQLSELKEIRFPDYGLNKKVTHHKLAIFAEKRDELKKYLATKNIQTNIHYDKLLFEYSLMEKYSYRAEKIIHAYEIKSKELTLPLYPELTPEEIDYICQSIKTFYV